MLCVLEKMKAVLIVQMQHWNSQTNDTQADEKRMQTSEQKPS